MKETNEMIKLKYKKNNKQRSIFNVKATYRCHHDTRYERTKEVDAVLDKSRNVICKFVNRKVQITFKVLKDNVNSFSCNVFI